MAQAPRVVPFLALFLVGSAGAQTVLEPGWTLAPFGSGIAAFNGLEHDCSRGEFWLGDNGLGQFLRLDSLGNPTVIDSGPIPDEVALDRTLNLLVVQYKPLVNRVYTTAGSFLGEWSDGTTFTGLAFDSAGDLFVGTWDQGIVRRYPRGTLPPNVPAFTSWASGLGAIEGIRFSCDDHLFATDYLGDNVFEVVPPAGPHITWASGLNGPLGLAFDPCTGDLFISNLDDGTILRATAPGVFTTFASGFGDVGAMAFDPDGVLHVSSPGRRQMFKLTPPRTCGAPGADAGPDRWICGGSVTLDGSGSSGCSGGSLRYRWRSGTTVVCDWSPSPPCTVAPSVTTTYTLEVQCKGLCVCAVASEDQVTVTVGEGPSAVLEPLDPICLVGSRLLDASRSSPGPCSAGLDYQFREGALILRTWDPSPSFGPVSPPATTVYSVDVRCAGGGSCITTADQLLIVDPDLVPGSLGNSLRAVRQGQVVAMSWASHPEARTYALYRAVVKQSWPPAPLQSGLPATVTALNDVPRPPSLYYYRVAGESCSGKIGP